MSLKCVATGEGSGHPGWNRTGTRTGQGHRRREDRPPGVVGPGTRGSRASLGRSRPGTRGGLGEAQVGDWAPGAGWGAAQAEAGHPGPR